MIEFSITQLSLNDKQNIVQNNCWSSECPIELSDLRIVVFPHYNFSEEVKRGNIIIHKKLSQNALSIFKELFELKFQINKAVSMDIYNGSDVDSMNDNNSSAFNGRRIMNSNKWIL